MAITISDRKRARKKRLSIYLWYRVETARPERVTAQDSADAEPESLDHTVSLESFKRIGRTCWIVTAAGWQKRRYTKLVAPDQQHAHGSHTNATFSEVAHRWRSHRRQAAGNWNRMPRALHELEGQYVPDRGEVACVQAHADVF